MILEELDHLLRKMGVRDTSPENSLERELELSQSERLHFCREINESFDVLIPNHDIKPELNMLELAGLISRKLLMTPQQEDFGAKLCEDIVINASAESVRQILLDVTGWPHLLPYVCDVKIIYADDVYQEFTMDLTGQNYERPEQVRSVRRCEPDHIMFFHPAPACFLKHHCGNWLIRPLSQNVTHLTLVRRWTSSTRAQTKFPVRNGLTPSDQVAGLLRKRARGALRTWKQTLERTKSSAGL